MITTDFISVKQLTEELGTDRTRLNYHINLGLLPKPVKVLSTLAYDNATADKVRQYFKSRDKWQPTKKGAI